MSENLPATQEQSWDDMLPVAASNKAIQRYNAVIDFAVNTLKFGMHYDVLPNEKFKCEGKTQAIILKDQSIKKFFTQAGADMVNMAWGVRSEAVILKSEERPDDKEPYFAYLVQVNLVHIGTGNVIGSAVGSCSSREVKYRYRWVTKEDVEQNPALADVNPEQCRSKVFGRGQYAKKKYQVINPDLGDIQPTIFMMAEKRAYVKATRRLFGLSELFNQPLDSIEQSTLEVIEEPEDEPKGPEHGTLTDKDLKAGDPAMHQDVRQPHSRNEPPPPGDSDAPLFDRKGSPLKGNPENKKVFDAFCRKHGIQKKPQAMRYLQDDLLLKKYKTDSPELVTADPNNFAAWLDIDAKAELQKENWIPGERDQ